MKDLDQKTIKTWLSDQLAIKGRGSKSALAKALDVRPDAVTRMLNVRNGEMRDISVDELAGMIKFFDASPPGVAVTFEAPPPQARTSRELLRVPLLDKVAAGKLKGPASQIPQEVATKLVFSDLGRGDFFALEVEGDSMDRISPEGSRIIVNKADRTLVAGRPYVFSIRGEATYKIWRSDPPRLAPHSTNPANEAIFLKPKQDPEGLVVGRVKRTVLDL